MSSSITFVFHLIIKFSCGIEKYSIHVWVCFTNTKTQKTRSRVQYNPDEDETDQRLEKPEGNKYAKIMTFPNLFLRITVQQQCH